jgi:hypothetical protein
MRNIRIATMTRSLLSSGVSLRGYSIGGRVIRHKRLDELDLDFGVHQFDSLINQLVHEEDQIDSDEMEA